MPSLVTNKFKLHNAKQFVESFTEPFGNKYYAFVGRHVQFADDQNPPAPDSSENGLLYVVYDEMVFGKQVGFGDVVHMVRRVDWVSNAVYDAYDHTDQTLTSKDFFVVSPEAGQFHIFKVLGNADGVPSTAQPLASQTSAAAESYITADGYSWKFMYSISASNFNKFATSSHIPVFPDSDVSGNAVGGAIDSVKVVAGGKNYKSHANGVFSGIAISGNTLIYDISGDQFSSNSGFYEESAAYLDVGGSKQVRKISDYNVSGSTKRIVVASAFDPLPSVNDPIEITPNVTISGDGVGAQARAIIDSGDSVTSVEVVDRGTNYTFGSATVVGNTGLVANPLADTANVSVIIGPSGGHGADVLVELDGHHVGMAVVFDGNEFSILPTENDFRTVGVIRDPLIANVEMQIDHSGAPRVVDGDTLYDANTNAHGEITSIASGADVVTINVDRVFGHFAVGSTLKSANSSASDPVAAAAANASNIAIVNTITNDVINNGVFDQRWVFNVTNVSGTATLDEVMVQDQDLSTEKTGVVHAANTSLINLTNVRGTFASSDVGGPTRFMDGVTSGSQYEILASAQPDLVDSTGEVIYLENIEPVTRDDDQKETFKVIIEF